MKKLAWEKWDSSGASLRLSEEEELNELSQDVMSEQLFAELMMEQPALTPFGKYYHDDPMSPVNMCECWICHSNFDITHSFISSVEKIPGVEILKVLSRYRFIIGLGKMFNFRNVRLAIENIYNDGDDNISEKIEFIKSQFDPSERWAIFVNNAGHIEVIVADGKCDLEFNAKIADEKQNSEVKVICYDD